MLRIIVMLLGCVLAAFAQGESRRDHEAGQLVLVVTPDWNATQGVVRSYDRIEDQWRQRGRDVPVSIGRAGAAWGVGLHEGQPGPQKKEGDGRSPAGMFSIGLAFGYADAEPTSLSYRPMTRFDYCIDVNASPLYNRIVDAREVGQAAVAQSTEPMRLDLHAGGDQRYKLGFVIEHNPDNVPARGSCIFAHLWGKPGQTTAGCSAMEEVAMRELLLWLDGGKKPVFVLLPQSEYDRLRAKWRLPDLAQAK